MHPKKLTLNTKLYYIWIGIILFFICISLISSQFGTPAHSTFDSEEVYLLDTVWHNTLDESEISQLPAVFPYSSDYTYTAYTILPEYADPSVNSLCFRASQSLVSVWLDDELLFSQNNHHHYKRSIFSGKAYGSHWVIVRLPDDYAGQELRIQSTSSHEKYAGVLNEIYAGTKSSLMYHIIHIHGLEFIVAALFFIVSTILFVFGLFCFLIQIPARQVLLLSLFGILSSFWMIGESMMLQFFTTHLIALHNATMLALNLIPVPMLFAISDLQNFRFKKPCLLAVHCHLLYVVFLIILQAANGPDLLEMVDVSRILLTIYCVILPILMYWDFFKNKNRQLISFAVAGLVLSIFCVMELVHGFLFPDRSIGGFFHYGILAFYLILCNFTIQQALNMYLKAKQTSFYQMLSHTDQMTNCRNRRDFTEHTASWKPGSNDVIIMVDINYLKTINDTYGHAVGDTYIMICAETLQIVFADMFECFRMGGDEFLIWGHDMTEAEITRLEETCSQLVIEKCKHISPLCSISIGSAIYRPEDESISDTIRRADLKMYEKKQKLKRVEISL